MKNPLCDDLLVNQPTNTEDDLYSSYIVNCVLNAFLSITAVLFNCATIHAIRKTSSLPKPLKTLLLSLAVSDLGVGLLVEPFYFGLLVKWLQRNSSTGDTCTAFLFIMGLFSAASYFGVVALSVDRFLAIHLHLRYQDVVTERRVVAVAIAIWVLSAILSFVRLWITTNMFLVFFVVISFLCFFTTTFLYFKIYRAVRRHRNQIHSLQVQVAQNGEMTANAASIRKSAVGAFYVYLVFFLCYFPQGCRLIVIIVTGLNNVTKGFSLYSRTLLFLNSSLNPIVYCWKMRHIRHAIVDILRNIFSSHS
ncbi:histamine H2 receptor-like [Oculina patagonica]